MDLVVKRAATLQGQLRPPSDKSLTHRAYMLAAIAKGPSEIIGPLASQDCESTLSCLRQIGLKYEEFGGARVLTPPESWSAPAGPLDCGNSGTTIRLLGGLVASRPISATLSGDSSLSKRPMRRIAEPLRVMGATVIGDTPPLEIQGAQLRGIEHRSPVSSAQVKSCLLLAGLRAEGPTIVREPSLSRDHTERMLSALGVDVRTLSGDGESIARLNPGAGIQGFRFEVPADISSAAFFIVGACLVPGSNLQIIDLGVNPTRTGILDVLRQVGARYSLEDGREELNEPVANFEIRRPTMLQPFEISGALVPRLIDEIPILAVLATQCDGTSTIRDAAELRVKESDRIELIASNLRAMGVEVEVHVDGLTIAGPARMKGAVVDPAGDHRIAMAFTIAGLIADGTTTIRGAECIATSYPDFERHLGGICAV